MNWLKILGNCCNPCRSPVVTKVPGEKGDEGTPGLDGQDGINAFTTVTTGFNMPDVGFTETVEVGTTIWMVEDQPIFLQVAGTMIVASIIDSTHVELENPGYPTNAAFNDPIPLGAKVSPGGRQGASGTAAAATGSVAIPSGVQSWTLPNQNFGFVPSVVVITIRKPAGGMTLFADIIDGTITGQTFTIFLQAATPASGYLVDYIAIP